MAIAIHTEADCQACIGTGKEIDQVATGAAMRAIRVAAGLKLREVAAAIGVSHPMLFWMERGVYKWTANRINDTNKAIERLKVKNG